MPRICVSQPVINTPNPSRREIHAALAQFGFLPLSLDAYMNPQTRILLTDAAPRHVKVVDGAIALFDAIASLATEEVFAWANSGGLQLD